ncbi:hypothetical protein GOARA_067_00750 [Gordonia araii NBRC 100433]|uniref:Septum formation initiator family protein n=1 Tax=Gordonia araii NBRC 100433 TaxID=1073574 RepID=G7H611_9ACTN|nr:septum formation initiator family protein [Gordonia araii]NNG96966.1 septum formation initiator family protein [Gordonia araii NBRC 100433]GAB11333.1 hypothetical protein GOARA_067_00750 [Gordonia araii NBRC 100433]
MAGRRKERADRTRSTRSSRNRPGASRPAAGRRPRNPAPQAAEPITDATSLDLINDDEVAEPPVPSAAVDADAVDGDVIDVDADVDGGDTGADDAVEAEPARVRQRRTSARAAAHRPRRAPARALAARWERLNPRRAIVLAVVLGFVALTLAMPLRTYFSQRAEADQMRATNAALEREIADLTRKVNEQGDPAYTEAQARARLQYVRPGETPFVLEIPGREAAAQERRRAAERAANPWFANLWDSVATPPQK